jgi:fructose-1,6-bisphosphatase/sedoheptulose 1,7-bisphosphatase-like protein
MNAYQQKWIEVLQHANVPNWAITGQDNDILIHVPDNHNIKELADNLETVLAEVSLDITLPKERLKFIIRNSREMVDYVLNPDESDLTGAEN